jgi:hypothetical protein
MIFSNAGILRELPFSRTPSGKVGVKLSKDGEARCQTQLRVDGVLRRMKNH